MIMYTVVHYYCILLKKLILLPGSLWLDGVAWAGTVKMCDCTHTNNAGVNCNRKY